ncbi:MAG: Flp pilus assembly complex ATPase component TadA [Planctomycetaceae bacterium]|nr:Flp pilus assembly complex ATPase component TadA [Planctomycetaceae bacterium]
MQIDQLLLQKGLISQQQLDLAHTQRNGHRIDEQLVEMGVITEEDALRTWADTLGMEYVDLQNTEIDLDLLRTFPMTVIYRHSILPFREVDDLVHVATGDPFDLESLDELSSLSGRELKPVLARKSEVVEMIKTHLGVGGDTINQLVSQRQQENGVELLEEIDEDIGEMAEEALAASVIRLVNELLVEAIDQQASDVHIEPHEKGLTVRFRVDGLLRVQPVPPEINHFASAIITRLKIMSHLNIAEKRLPQDGRIKLRVKGREIDVRVSIIPMIFGEGIVMRLLDKERMVFNLANVGMPPEIISPFKKLISLPHGIILVTGPTGSGKSSTLYSSLNEIKDPKTKIITVEDPVEYHSTGISQIQVHSRIGLTFAAGLRSILRHDPDVILIGEIRDGETAQSAIQASLTGHLVFSTLHTNDAPGSMTRLIDMGVEPYLVASTVEGVLAQRLLRKLCTKCKAIDNSLVEDFPVDFPVKQIEGPIYKEVGCRDCRDIGYAGRTGIFELMQMDEEIRHMTVNNASTGAIRNHALKNGMVSLRQSGWNKVLEGVTSIDEVLRISKGEYS